MKLKKLYSLRKDFVVIGLTGRVGAGCSEIASQLANDNFISAMEYKKESNLLEAEKIKFDICYNYLNTKDNFSCFKIINYKDVLVLNLLFECSAKDEPIKYFKEVISQYGDNYKDYENRFGFESDPNFFLELDQLLNKKLLNLLEKFKVNPQSTLNKWLKNQSDTSFVQFYDSEVSTFNKKLFRLMNNFSITKRTRFLHDISINLRSTGLCLQKPILSADSLENIYTVAESINRIIKLIRKENGSKVRIVIDSLKNSLELMYFKEKYGGFYMIAVNKNEAERENYIRNSIKKINVPDHDKHATEIINLDNAEYKGDAVNSGQFTVPDIENCIQKSDFHIFHSINNDVNGKDRSISLSYQLTKLLALIGQPGIITPTAIERTMQVAFNAKYNSGCISRQVGAVVTDEFYSVKSIGWNDVAANQMPCKLRDIRDLTSDKPSELFSSYEKIGGEFIVEDKTKTFKQLVKEDIAELDLDDNEGRSCSFCFKTFQNTYEREKNQVHTRSLHAEENAMMQITKNGGVGLKGGYLFTTASPCELCSKKAYQLGVKKIFYIDPYPGIAMEHTLSNGVNSDDNPEMEMFRGAVGRCFHKLYEPFMSHKDEMKILTGLSPKRREKSPEDVVKNMNITDGEKKQIIEILNNSDNRR